MPSTRGQLLRIVAAVAGLSAALLAGILFAAGAVHRSGGTTTVVVRSPLEEGVTGALDGRALYARTAPGVVDISSTLPSGADPRTFGGLQPGRMSGTGSVIDARGHILTAQHVIKRATSVSVRFQDGTIRAATVLGQDAATDIAVLKVSTAGLTLHPLPLGSSEALKVGDELAVIGDPFGYARSLSTGVASGLDRTIEAPNGFNVSHVIQTDAALNPGNSGGPVLDVSGRVIGVADQIAATGADRSNTGVGFAVPIDVVKPTLATLIAGRRPAHPYLGVSAGDGVDTPGALVQDVTPGAPAARAGVRVGDLIVALGGARIGGVSDLLGAVASHPVGARVSVTVHRSGTRRTLGLTLGRQPTEASRR
jgi:S1-C subfamily serine protease